MTEPLKDSIVLITGAGSGIGRALAQEASRHGHRLILVGRRPGPLQDTADLLARPDTLCLSADIATAEGRAAIVAAVALAGGLDILINNAGSVASGPISAVGDAELEQLIRTNVIAPIALSRELLPFLAERSGQVVNVGSVFGDIAFPFFGLYSTSKFAMRGFSEAMRRELAPKGIAVTYLAPRGTKTGAADNFGALVGPMGMKLDTPEAVAARAWQAIGRRARSQYPKTAERFFVALQRLCPGLIDRALTKLAADPKVVTAATRRD